MQSPEAQLKLIEMSQNPRAKRYFFTNRNFKEGFVPVKFHRTEVPRVSTFGSTLHEMKKVLKNRVLQLLPKGNDLKIMDLDFSGAHAVLTCRLQSQNYSL